MADLERLVELIGQVQYLGGLELALADHLIAHGVTIPVRCKDCRYARANENNPRKPLICYMTRMCGTVEPEWYCWQGERKENG